MRIVIIGVGKVGNTLVEQLSKEGHDIIVIDINKKVIEKTINGFDAMGVLGNGADHNVQKEAKVDLCDLMIASTHSDELNILCCMVAKKLGNADTIARIRNPEYFTLFIGDELGLNLMINPEYEAAMEIFRILRSPGTIKIDPFSNGKVELVEFKLCETNPLIDMAISQIPAKLQLKMLISAVERDEDVFIPNGNFVLKANDKIFITATAKDTYIVLKKLGIFKSIVKNVMIVGGGKISFYLAKQLEKVGISVKIIEKNERKCQELSEQLNKTEIIVGDGSDRDILIDEGLMRTDALIILTSSDEENIMISLFASSKKIKKIVTKINRFSYYSMLKESGIESIISPRLLMSNIIVRYVRGKQNSMGSTVLNLYKIINEKAEALEFIVTDTFRASSVPIKTLKLKNNLLISCIMRNGQMITPDGDETIEIGDNVIIVTTNEFLNDLNDILQ
ncbi:MAG: Trk system potassium transporter TrkA [Clostridia bacterium]|nr:Trk system potassium transporter TrkA [Clostridia bacterium]